MWETRIAQPPKYTVHFTGLGFLLQADSTLTDTQRAAAALPVCCKCAGVMAELRGASHSSSSRQFDRLAAPALLPPGLVDAVVAQLASRCHEPTEYLRGASTHVARMRAGTVGQWERTWKSVAAVLAHGASRPARCSIPRPCPSRSSTTRSRPLQDEGVVV